MQNEIVINATTGETRVAIFEKNQFVDLLIERQNQTSVEGAVVKGRVTRVLPGMQAAFVDIGLEKAAFLYAGDYVEDIEHIEEKRSRDAGRGRQRGGRNGGSRRAPPDISTLLEEGQEILVQIAKEPIGTKGARITSHVSIAGRHLVLTPWSQRVGVSRRIDSDKERRRLRQMVDKVRPNDLGFIIRTVGEGIREADLEADVRYLTKVWDEIQMRKDEVRAPAVLYAEPALPLRVIRDFANGETRRIVIDSEPVYEEMKSFMADFVADPKPKLELFRGAEPVFDHFGAEAEIDTNVGRKVWLKSGGYLIIDQSEALTAIDVNTGRYVGKRDLEETVLRTNLEAVREVVNQLRFRNIGGLIIIDLIDMEPAENRDKVNRALQEAIRHDKAKTNILKISELGLVEMTRKRTRENLMQTLCEPCPYCESKGYVLSVESVAHKVLRQIRKDLPRMCGRRIQVTLHRRVAELLLGQGKEELKTLEDELGREIELQVRVDLHQEQFEVRALDEGPPIEIDIPWLRDAKPEAPAPAEPAAAEEVAAVAEAPTVEVADEAPDALGGLAAVGAATQPDQALAAPAPEAGIGDESAAPDPGDGDGAAERLQAAEPGPAPAPDPPGVAVDAQGRFPILPDSDEREER